MFPSHFHVYLQTRIGLLEQELVEKNAYIQILQSRINQLQESKPISNKSCQTYTETGNKNIQTCASVANCVFVQTKSTRKERKDLTSNQKGNRNLENKAAFTQVANIIEGGDKREEIERIFVSIEYKDRTKYSFYAKGEAGEEAGQKIVPLEVLHKILEVKLRFRLSYQALRELRLIGLPAIPPQQDLCEEFNRLAGTIHIYGPPRVSISVLNIPFFNF